MALLTGRVVNPILPIFGVLAAAAAGSVVWQLSDQFSPFIDFTKAYYRAGAAILAGDFDALRLLLRTAAFVNLPIVAALFAPLAFCGESDAILIFTALGFLATLAAWWLLARVLNMNARQTAWLLALFLVNGPLIYSLKLGNTTHFILVLIVLGLMTLKSGRNFLAGGVFALTAAVKPMLLLAGAYVMLTARWREVIGGATVLAGIAAASVAIFGIEMHRDWMEGAILPFVGHPMAAFNNQSLDAFLVRFDVGPEHAFNWLPLEPTATYAAWRTSLVGAILAGTVFAIGCSRISRPNATTEMSLVIATAVILCPVSWSHYHCMLLVPWAVLLTSTPSRASRLLLTAAIVLGSLPPTVFGWHENYWRTLTSAHFFAAVLTWATLIIAMQPVQSVRGLLAKVTQPSRPDPAPTLTSFRSR
jgi:hypothetical protein